MPLLHLPQRCYCRLDGLDGQPVVVLLHPIGFDHSFWDGVARCLQPEFLVLRPDLPGHGASELIEPADLAQYARAVVGMLEVLGINSFAVAGVSLGGFVAMAIAASVPERLTALVVTSAGLRFPEPEGGWERRLTMATEEPMKTAAARARALLLSAPTLPPEVAASLHRTMTLNGQRGYVTALAALRDADAGAFLPRFSSPCLVLNGKDESGRATALAQAMGAPLTLLEAGHLPPVECPGAYADALKQFLESFSCAPA